MYANSIAIKAYAIRTAAHHLQATFTWASAVDLGQGLGTLVADLVERQVEPLQVREVRQVLDHPDAVVVQAKLRERRERREVRDAVQTAEGQRDVLGVFELHRAALRVQVLRRAVHLTEWSGAERREEG